MQTASETKSRKIGIGIKVLYGVGEIANAIKVVTFGLFSLFFATTVKGLPGTWIGIVGFAAMFWDAIIDPYIGYLTDGVHADSRRRGYMLAGALVMGIGFWAFFSPPAGLTQPMLFGWLLVASFIVRSATSMYSIPYYAVGANLSSDYHERTSITGIRGLAGTIGTLLTASLSFVVFFPEKVPGVDPKLNPGGYTSMGLVFGAVMTAVSLIGFLGTWLLHRSDTAEAQPSQPAPGSFFKSMLGCFDNPSFRVLLLAMALGVIAMTVSSSLLIYYVKYYVQIDGSAALSASQGIFLLAGLIGTPVWLRLSRSFEKHRLYVVSALATSILMIGAVTLFGSGHLFGIGQQRPMLAGYAITGFVNCLLWFIPQSMIADVVDESELMTGIRRDGALFGVSSFCQQLATGVAVMLAGTLLEYFIGLVPGGAQQSDATVYRIGLVYSLVPAALFAAAGFVMRGYKLDRARVAEVQAKLNARNVAPNVHAARMG